MAARWCVGVIGTARRGRDRRRDGGVDGADLVGGGERILRKGLPPPPFAFLVLGVLVVSVTLALSQLGARMAQEFRSGYSSPSRASEYRSNSRCTRWSSEAHAGPNELLGPQPRYRDRRNCRVRRRARQGGLGRTPAGRGLERARPRAARQRRHGRLPPRRGFGISAKIG